MTPYAPAVAIGKGVKIADTVTGGKASKALGTSLTIANKLAPGAGHLVQGATNLASKTRLLEKLNKAMAIKRNVEENL